VTSYAGRLVVHDREIHLEPYADALAVGDVLEVIRGNGPREGARMGTATVTGYEDGSPVHNVSFGDDGRAVTAGELRR
jgi:hypothetical protein